MSKIALRKVGSSFVTTIPAELVQALHLAEGQQFEVTQEDGRLVLTPVTPEHEELLAAHKEVLQRYRDAFKRLADA